MWQRWSFRFVALADNAITAKRPGRLLDDAGVSSVLFGTPGGREASSFRGFRGSDSTSKRYP
jgi:hypothetical protein